QQIAEDMPIVQLIFDHQDALFRHGAACFATMIGRVNEKVDPRPGFDSTQIRPPCISTIRLAIDRPRPVPPLVLVDELSACWNSTKILAWSAAAMPGPVSCTATVNEPSAAEALTATSPASVNLMALPTKLSRT